MGLLFLQKVYSSIMDSEIKVIFVLEYDFVAIKTVVRKAMCRQK